MSCPLGGALAGGDQNLLADRAKSDVSGFVSALQLLLLRLRRRHHHLLLHLGFLSLFTLPSDLDRFPPFRPPLLINVAN